MKLIENYINLLTKENVEKFAIKNDIFLSDTELDYIFNLVKTKWKDILKDDEYYLKEIENNLSYNNFIKIKDLFLYYKNRYKGYLF